VTDEQEKRYLDLIAPIRERYIQEQYRLEAKAAAGIARDLEGLHGVVSPAIADYVEERWTTWLDFALERAMIRYEKESQRIEREVMSC
jgi:hypothetical protein